MNKYNSNAISFRRWASILSSILLLVLGALYFFNASANTEDGEKSSEDDLVLGRLAFGRQVTQMSQESFIETSNPDGSDRFTLPTSSTGNVAQEAAWSPDGTKIAYAVATPTLDIWFANANGTGQTNLTNTGFDARETNPSWSVTGKIAYERRLTSGGVPQIWTVNEDGSGQAQFSAITQPSPTGPAWSPDGLKLAFASGGEIWVINANGTNELRLTTNATADADPAWSPDGAKIVFGRGTSGLATINADGTNETPLTNGNHTQPSWSPDGTKIAYTSGGIWTMDAGGANQVRIFQDSSGPFPAPSVSYSSPAWQPVAQTPNTFNITGRITHSTVPARGITVNLGGTVNAATTTDSAGNYQFSSLPAGGNYTVSPSFPRHYFTPPNRAFNNLNSNQSGNFEVLSVCHFGNCVTNGKIGFVRNSEIFTINADRTGETNITNHAASDGAPDFARDGSMIFQTNRDGNFEIYRMAALDSAPVNLTNNGSTDTSPSYSFDGRSIVFTTDRDGNSEIYKMNPDGTNQVRLTNDAGHDSSASFSPDGQKILFVRQNPPQFNLFMMNADGTDQQLLLGPVNFLTSPSYSPDGTKIIMVFGVDDTQQTIYTMNADGTNLVPAGFGRSQPTYSPDGLKVVHNCCFSSGPNFQNGLFVTRLATVMSQQRLTSLDEIAPDWQPIAAPRPAAFDFDGDGRADISFFRSDGGFWYQFRSAGGVVVAPQWGLATDVLTPADYDGDLKTDIAVWRPSDGNFYVLNSFDLTVRIENFGLPGDVPTGGDFDGDGKADVALYRSGAQSVFYYRGSMGNPNKDISSIPWGVAGDKPVVGDYDGDGLSDAAVYRSGIWYIRQSSNGQLAAANFGLADDALIPADYDGDGKTDIAVFRNGIWYLLRTAQGFGAFQFGIAEDVPAPADYDGDGRADAAIYRDGVWWILKSASGSVEATPFGTSGDDPIPSAYVR